MSGRQARALVEGTLGRPAQDCLEAAVVLEAWGGLTPRSALELAGQVVAHTPRHALMPSSPPSEPVMHAPSAGQGGLLLAVVVSTISALLLAGALDQASVTGAWNVALPVTLALQWTLGRRYLGGDHGVARLRRGAGSAAALIGLATGAALAAPGGGPVAAGLVLLWTAAIVLARRGWGTWCAAVMGASLVVAWAGWLSQASALLAGVALTIGGAVVAVGTVSGEAPAPAPWRRALPSGLAGAGVGVLFVVGVGRSFGLAGFCVILVPSLLGGLWAGQHLSRLWDAVPRCLAGTPVYRRSPARLPAVTAMVLAGSVVRLMAVTLGASLLLVAMADAPGRAAPPGTTLLVSVPALGLLALLATTVDSFGRPAWAAAAVGAACAGHELTVRLAPGADEVTAMLVAVALGIAVAAWPVAELVREPDRVLATPP